jgi:hypothetical protein
MSWQEQTTFWWEPSYSWSYGSWIYNYLCNQCLSPLKLWGVLDTTLCDKVYQWLAAGWWFSLGTSVSSTNKTDRHNITDSLGSVLSIFSTRNCVSVVFEPTTYILWKKYITRVTQGCGGLGLWCLTPLSTIFQLHHGGQFYGIWISLTEKKARFLTYTSICLQESENISFGLMGMIVRQWEFFPHRTARTE